MNRRAMLLALAAMPLAGRAALAGGETVHVAKSPYCGCCGGWIEHMRAAGFRIEVSDVEPEALDALKARMGIAPEHQSCHTAQVGGYFIEGHVPPSDVQRLLTERPAGRGLVVPGMPAGSPGMEMGGQREPYDVVLIGETGQATVFRSYR